MHSIFIHTRNTEFKDDKYVVSLIVTFYDMVEGSLQEVRKEDVTFSDLSADDIGYSAIYTRVVEHFDITFDSPENE